MITAIRYYKKEGEYRVSRRDENGKMHVMYCNRLNEEEKAWAQTAKFFFDDDPICVLWTN